MFCCFLVSRPRSVSVTSDPVSPIRPVGSNVTVTCTVELIAPIYDASLTLEIRLVDPAGNLLSDTTSSKSDTVYVSSRTSISMFQRHQSGLYSCTASISSPSAVKTLSGASNISTGILVPLHGCQIVLYTIPVPPAGVYLSLNGTFHANNSVFFVTDIGNSSTHSSLQCITDRIPCCRSPTYMSRVGEWYFPDKVQVPLLGSATTFYRNRGHNGNINLNRLGNNTLSPVGLFCCVVPDANDISYRLCANICEFHHKIHIIITL